MQTIQKLDWKREQPTGWRRWHWFNLPELQVRFQEILDSMPEVSVRRAFEVQGIMQLNEHLTWRLDLILKGLATPELLHDYGSERIEQTTYLIGVAVEIGKLICMLDPAEAAERNKAMLAVVTDSSLASILFL